MNNLSLIKFDNYLHAHLIPVAGVAAISFCSGLLFHKIWTMSTNKLKNNNVLYRVLFFPDNKIPCYKYLLTAQGCFRKNCKYNHDEEISPFIQLVRLILNTRDSIDLCMFSLTDMKLATAILIKHRQGAKVRVITDTEYMNLSGSQIYELLKEGIEVRHDKTQYLMHHKFAVIDKKIVLTGSFNWTQAAVMGNNENILVTSDQEISRQYLNEFDKLWNGFITKKDKKEMKLKQRN